MLELRKQVYEANMELYRNHLAPLTWGNVSQVDRSLGVMAIKPSGVPYERLSAEDITVVSLETGERVAGHLNPSSDTPTHLALYRAFPGIGGITHTHSPYATAWAQAGRPLRCLGTTHADCFYGEVPVTRYVSREEAARAYEAETGTVIVEAFAGRDPVHTPGVLVRGHGPFTWGDSALKSVYNAITLEEVARMNLLTLLLDGNVPDLPEALQSKHFERKHGPNAYYGQGSNG
ncbi:MAG TPA: L-ribulose-5-phosphate 4-epimerase AraD [Candidatus Ornithocaccomicrobium faecavium]|uniref:L-ribulose-5-phosphate 4-epimerase n=1 Tax=Candidatus Ornithocaccomicrobium faecavium TaxID=2840890 RepID=A0A9D1P7B1_9FIRM|nr:L-ribulose-5-phosphate 4-epimerase AraD [Candidatus Ornithocaccomicrobium faecavium]